MTEPEAAALRNVLRRLRVLIDKALAQQMESALRSVLGEARDAVQAGLDRPKTNDAVIDGLQREVRDLRAVTIDMEALKLDRLKAESERDALLDERRNLEGAPPKRDEQRILDRMLEYACLAACGECLSDQENEFVSWGIIDAATSYATLGLDQEEREQMAALKLHEVRRSIAHAMRCQGAVEKEIDDDED
jgi:hypothetical protein